jgi:tetratricopeptide (TPR) repeat protein
MYANRSAIEHYEAARSRLLEAHADHAPLGRLDEKLGSVLMTNGQLDAALEALDRAAGLYAVSHDLEAQARVTDLIGMVHTERGSAGEGEMRIRQLLETVAENERSPALAGLYVTLARIRLYTGKLNEVVEVAEHASELGRALGDDSIVVRAETWRGMGLMMLGRLDEAHRVIETVLPLAEAVAEPGPLAYALTIIAHTSQQGGELEKSIAVRRRELEIVQRMGDPVRTGYALGQLGETLFFVGDWHEARAMLEQGRRALHTLGSPWASAYPVLSLGWLYMAEGRWDEASSLLEEAIAVGTKSRDQLVVRRARSLQAEHELVRGNGVAALAMVQPLLDSPGAETMIVGTRLLSLRAWAHLEMGDIAQAEAAIEDAVEQARQHGQRMMLLDALRIHGMILARRREWQEAEQVLDEAVSASRAAQYPYAEARALYEWGMMCLQRGSSEQARTLLEAAREILQRLGARPYLERAEQALATASSRQPA